MRRNQVAIEPAEAWWEAATAIPGLSVGEAALLCGILALLLFVRMSGRQAMKDALGAKNATRALNISALSRVTLVKEVFMAYLSAAILEPLLSIANTESSATSKELFVTVMEVLDAVRTWDPPTAGRLILCSPRDLSAPSTNFLDVHAH